jgi:hypothetical protein
MTIVVHVVRIDWSRVLLDLESAALSLRRIEHLTGISKSALSRYRNGAAPMHADGELLITLWSESQQADRDALPVLSRGENVPASGRGMR